MNSVYIYHHLGLGDHIICNGLVRHFAELYGQTFVFTKPVNKINIKRMYSDNKKITILPMSDQQVREFINIFKSHKYVIAGHTPEFEKKYNDPNLHKNFDELFYEDNNIPFIYKWTKFFVERDLKREKEVYYDIYGLNDDSEFIFVHENPIYSPVVQNISENIQKIMPDNKEVGIFDYLYLIEKAKEVHVMNSSFMNLIDCIQLRNDNIYYHEYARPGINTILKLNWTIFK